MKKILIALSFVSIILVGCSPANITGTKWDSGIKGSNVETRCMRIDMRNQSEMDSVFSKYDGWKLIYVSEYTTGNKFGTDAAVCFEREK